MTSTRLNDDRCTPILRERIKALFRPLPKALVGDAESIHQLRVAGRRLRATLPLLSQKSRGRRVRRADKILGDLTRGTGGSRDIDVSLGMLSDRSRDLGRASSQLSVLRRRLSGARSRSRGRMAEAVLDLEIAALRRDLRAIVARRGERLFTVLLRFRDTKEEMGAKLVLAMETLGDRFDPGELHRLRIRCRRLRYVAELGDRLKDQSSEATVLFKQLQEQLGLIHDAHVLATWLGQQAATARTRRQRALAAAAAEQEAFFLAESRRHHREYLDRGPLELVKRGLDAMGGTRSAA